MYTLTGFSKTLERGGVFSRGPFAILGLLGARCFVVSWEVTAVRRMKQPSEADALRPVPVTSGLQGGE